MSSNQLRKSLLSNDFAARRKIHPNPISCIAAHIDCVRAVDMNDLMLDGEHRAIWECVVLLGCKWTQINLLRCDMMGYNCSLIVMKHFEY
jgi:hypothetical protein